jgi:(2Fe-2S) ferredoxin
MCHQMPLLEIVTPQGSPRLFARVSAEDATRIVREHFRPRGIRRRVTQAVSRWLDRLATDEDDDPRASCQIDVRDAVRTSADSNVATQYLANDPATWTLLRHIPGLRAVWKVSPKAIAEVKPRSARPGWGGLHGVKWATVVLLPAKKSRR